MAVSSSFKQQCPSCEAMVPIKDSTLIGKKIECPKCKYRFVVEKPAEADDTDDDDVDEKPAAKGKNGAAAKGKNGTAAKANGAAKAKDDKPGKRFRDDDVDDDDEEEEAKP